MNIFLNQKYGHFKDPVIKFIKNFSNSGKSITYGARNNIKIFEHEGALFNVKSFKIPNAINKIAYKFFRKSKAQRSFDYAQYLISKNIGTPHPIAYFEKSKAFAFLESYYVSEHLESDLTYRELVLHPNYPNHEAILRAFTRFTFELHEAGIEFLDHSPGNTLIIKQKDGSYKFYLVDLNRMNFRKMDFRRRMKNFARLTPKKEMIETMANEYAKCIKKPEAEVFEKMWKYTNEFQEKFQRKQRWKKKIKKARE